MARKCGFKEIEVHFGTFDYTVLCVVGPYENLGKYATWRLEDDSFLPALNDLTHKPRGRFISRDGWVPIVWIPRKPKTPEEHATLAHEMLHAVRAILVDWAGMDLTHDTDEAFCHALGHGIRTVMRAL